MTTKIIIKELILNAIVNKDYTTGIPIQISIHEDKITIFNPGNWPKGLPTDAGLYNKHPSIPFNPKLSDVLFRAGDIEAWGTGFMIIKGQCSLINSELPQINVSDEGVTITVFPSKNYIQNN